MDAVDVVFVTGDAYVDHPSFAMALLGRLLEAEGYRWPFSASRIGIRPSRGAVRPAANLLCRQCGQHGFDDQPLHGQPQGATTTLTALAGKLACGPTGPRWPIVNAGKPTGACP